MLLRYLYLHDSTAIELSDLLGLSKSSITRMLNDLEKRKLVIRTINQDDRRKINIEVTKTGLDQLKYSTICLQESGKKIFDNLGTNAGSMLKYFNETVEILNMDKDDEKMIKNRRKNKIINFFVERSDSKSDKVLLNLHGGAYILSLDAHPIAYARMASNYVQYGEIDVLTVDYRTAPDYPYPYALNDAILTYQYLLDNGYKGSDIIVA